LTLQVCFYCGAELKTDLFGVRRINCPYCRQENELINTPDLDWVHPGKKPSNKRTGISGMHVVDSQRSEYISKIEVNELPGKVRQVLRIILDYGLEILTTEMRQELYAAGVVLFIYPEAVNPNRREDLYSMGYRFCEKLPDSSHPKNLICQGRYLDHKMKQLDFTLYDKQDFLNVNDGRRDVLGYAGPQIEKEGLIKCPNPQCDASISKDSKKYQWCGKSR
jgi:hypothetical protein